MIYNIHKLMQAMPLALLYAILVAMPLTVSSKVNPLAISADGHHFIDKKSGKPVFLLCDTGWNLLSLNFDEYSQYISSRTDNGFNTVMFALSFEPQAKAENAYGERMYIGDDKTELNPKAMRYADRVVADCNRRGLYVMIYCMWAGAKSGTMNNYTPQQLYDIGLKIGRHFHGKDNVILVTGGESTPHFIDTAYTAAIGRGLKQGCKGRNLVGVHPVSEHSSSDFFATCPWIDFYMIQGKSNLSGSNYDYERLITRDFNRRPTRPTMLIEHRYESGTAEDPLTQRRHLYLSTIAGCAGWGYGHNALWQMTPNTGLPWMLRSWAPGTDSWKKVLYTEAARQLHHVFTLANALPLMARHPADSLLISPAKGDITVRPVAARDGHPGRNDATYVIVYLQTNDETLVRTDVIGTKRLNVWLFNTADGTTERIMTNISNTGKLSIKTDKKYHDAVAVITSNDTGYMK